MSFSTKCPVCKQCFDVPDKNENTEVECLHCHEKMITQKYVPSDENENNETENHSFKLSNFKLTPKNIFTVIIILVLLLITVSFIIFASATQITPKQISAMLTGKKKINITWFGIKMGDVRVSASGKYSDKIKDTLTSFRNQDTIANNIYQQIQNGTYRTVEMLNIIVSTLNE